MVSGVVDGEISRAMILALFSDTQRIPPIYLLGQESSCSTMYRQANRCPPSPRNEAAWMAVYFLCWPLLPLIELLRTEGYLASWQLHYQWWSELDRGLRRFRFSPRWLGFSDS